MRISAQRLHLLLCALHALAHRNLTLARICYGLAMPRQAPHKPATTHRVLGAYIPTRDTLRASSGFPSVTFLHLAHAAISAIALASAGAFGAVAYACIHHMPIN